MSFRKLPRWLVGAIMVGTIATLGIKPASAVYQIGEHVSDFTLRNSYNQWVSLYDYSDRIVVLAFWFST
jgi:hypothetical protein